MRRNYWVVVANVLVLAVLAGCRDNGVSPVALANDQPASMMLAPEGRPSLSLSGTSVSDATTDFNVGPRGGVFYVGNHAVVFPANSICDPARSSYGAGTWDDACALLRKPLTIHAVVRSQNGRSWVDFSPELRFAPSDNPSSWVWMYMRTPQTVGAAGDLSRFSILYAASIGGAMENDAASDPSLRTYVDTRGGLSFRRIKHFSGYTASSGNACVIGTTSDGCPGSGAYGLTLQP